jgi:hypothetical protein
LPTVRTEQSVLIASAMDEVLCAGAGPDDVVATGRAVNPVLAGALHQASLDCHMVVVPGRDDVPVEVRLSRPATAPWLDVSGCLDPVPYAVVPGTHAVAGQCGGPARLPSLPTVSLVNSKTWSNGLVQALGLFGAAAIGRSPAEVRRLAGAADSAQVVLKDPYGVCGQGALTVATPRILDTVVRVLERQADRGANVELLVQPLFPVAESFSGHLVIDPSGGITLLGFQRTMNDGFAYAGSGPVPPELERTLERSGYPDVLIEVGKILFQAGYHGPVCVDSLLLTDDTIVPVLEINARQSMGLLSLRLNERVADRAVTARLRSRHTRVDDANFTERLIERLRASGLLWPGHGRGVMPLASGPLRPPRGRLFYALFAVADEDFETLDTATGQHLDALLDPS